MNGILIDSCVLLDLLTNDKNWADRSEKILEQYSQSNSLFINSVVYTEISIGFKTTEEVDETLTKMGIKVLEIPREALFLAGKVYLQY
ncbi:MULTISPECIES: PIN domain-containing protein [unclassified Endozoicomonas]|uniref:PIN domain-containing protein n=1 Tax=unclassified Endozoicomonas TaxID=2644528 RepID=UPI003BAE1BE0